MEQAEADKKIAQAKAEERRAMAVAKEQEMKARVEEMRAKVVEAEATVPLSYGGSTTWREFGRYGLYEFTKYYCGYRYERFDWKNDRS